MEKASSKEEPMSLEEWEFLDFGLDGKDLSQKVFFDPKGIIDMNYFICPSQYPTPPPLPPRPAHLETHRQDDDGGGDGGGGGDEPCTEFVKDIPVVVLPDQDPVSQVFFKKMRDAEFVDMKMGGSPRASPKLIFPHAEPDPILFDEEEEEEEEGLCSSKGEFAEDKAPKKNSAELREGEEEEDDNDDGDDGNNNNNNKNNKNMCSEDKGNQLLEGVGFTVWRWRVNGIGALCSVGVAAAATICVFVLGGKQKQKQQHQQPKIQFQIYTEDKRIKQVVQQATRLNQAISAMRGAPITRAHISFGGYYDGL